MQVTLNYAVSLWLQELEPFVWTLWLLSWSINSLPFADYRDLLPRSQSATAPRRVSYKSQSHTPPSCLAGNARLPENDCDCSDAKPIEQSRDVWNTYYYICYIARNVAPPESGMFDHLLLSKWQHTSVAISGYIFPTADLSCMRPSHVWTHKTQPRRYWELV